MFHFLLNISVVRSYVIGTLPYMIREILYTQITEKDSYVL